MREALKKFFSCLFFSFFCLDDNEVFTLSLFLLEFVSLILFKRSILAIFLLLGRSFDCAAFAFRGVLAGRLIFFFVFGHSSFFVSTSAESSSGVCKCSFIFIIFIW